METLTITNNGATIQLNGSYAEIAQFLLSLTNAQPAAVTDNQTSILSSTEPEELQPFVDFLTKELSVHFSESDAKVIVSTLEKIRRCTFPDYRDFSFLYRQVNDTEVEKRQLMLTVSAVWRYKFGSGSSKYQLKSIIKYASACPHCGRFASSMMDRLKKEGLW
jgi:hypothetical protein